jgi:hypothetical protein
MLGGQVLGVLGRVAQARAAVTAVGGELLVFVLGDEPPTRIRVDRLAALAQLLWDRAALVLGALGGVDDAGDHGGVVDRSRLSVARSWGETASGLGERSGGKWRTARGSPICLASGGTIQVAKCKTTIVTGSTAAIERRRRTVQSRRRAKRWALASSSRASNSRVWSVTLEA